MKHALYKAFAAMLLLGGLGASAQAQLSTGPDPLLLDNPFNLKYNAPSIERGQRAAVACVSCHGQGLQSKHETIPSLAGQNPSYLTLQIAAFRAKLRPSPVMQQVLRVFPLTDQEIVDIGVYAQSLPPVAESAFKADPEARQRGQTLYLSGNPSTGALACVTCHNADGSGNQIWGIARITNQSPGYLKSIMEDFLLNTKLTPGAPKAMQAILRTYSEKELSDLRAYISTMNPKN